MTIAGNNSTSTRHTMTMPMTQMMARAHYHYLPTSAWKSSPKTEKRLQLDWTKTAKDWTSSLGLSLLRFQDCKKTGYGGLVLSVKTGLL